MKTTHHQHCLMLGKFHDRLSSRNTNAIEMARFWVTRESDLCPPPAVTSCRERRRGSATRRVCTAVFLLCITWHCGINNRAVQRRLLQEPSLSYDKALEIALSSEAAEKDSKRLTGGTEDKDLPGCRACEGPP